jgi:hypothetical protein
MTTTFLKFSLHDQTGQTILGIDDGALRQSLILEIKNSAREEISIQPLKDNKAYHFCLNFRPGTLLLSGIDKVTLSEKNIQEKWELRKDKDKSSFYFIYKGETDIILNPDAKNSLILTLENISAEPGGGARGTRVELNYQNLFYADDQNSMTGTLLQYLNIVNHRGNQQLPLYIGFTSSDKVDSSQTINLANKSSKKEPAQPEAITISNLRVVGSNRILNDGTPNELILSFRHLQKNPFQKKENEIGLSVLGTDKHKDAATNFKISFDVLPKESQQNIRQIGIDMQEVAKKISDHADKSPEKITKDLEKDLEELKKLIKQIQDISHQEPLKKRIENLEKENSNIESLCKKILELLESKKIIVDSKVIKTSTESIQKLGKHIESLAQKLPEDKREALLCTTDASKIEIKLNKDYGKDWKIDQNLQGASPQWTLTRKTTDTQLTDEILRLDINNIITLLPAGYGNLYVYYENIPGYWDGYVICPIEKGPLMFRKDGKGQESLGIGTDEPEAKLHVVQKGLTHVAVFKGKTGIAIKGTEGASHALWITDAKTSSDFPALYVQQKGEGGAAHFEGGVIIIDEIKRDRPALYVQQKGGGDAAHFEGGGVVIDEITKGNALQIRVHESENRSNRDDGKAALDVYQGGNGLAANFAGNVKISGGGEMHALHITCISETGQPALAVEQNGEKGLAAKFKGDVEVSGKISCGGKIGIKAPTGRYLIDSKSTNWKESSRNYAMFHENFTEDKYFTLEMSCSRDIKENIVSLTSEEANNTLAQLNAVKYDYIGEPAFRPNLGFIAEEMPDNLASADRKTLSPFEVIPVLTKVVQEQQQKIDSLQFEVSELQKKLAHSEDLG